MLFIILFLYFKFFDTVLIDFSSFCWVTFELINYYRRILWCHQWHRITFSPYFGGIRFCIFNTNIEQWILVNQQNILYEWNMSKFTCELSKSLISMEENILWKSVSLHWSWKNIESYSYRKYIEISSINFWISESVNQVIFLSEPLMR